MIGIRNERQRQVLIALVMVVTAGGLAGCQNLGTSTPETGTSTSPGGAPEKWTPYNMSVTGPTALDVGERVNLTVKIRPPADRQTISGGDGQSLRENVTVRVTQTDSIQGDTTRTFNSLSPNETVQWTVTYRPDRKGTTDLYFVVELGDREIQRHLHRMYVGVTPGEDPPVVETVTGIQPNKTAAAATVTDKS